MKPRWNVHALATIGTLCRWAVRPLVLLALLGVSTAQAQLKYRVQDLGTLQGGNESLYGIALNNNGAVVGGSTNNDEPASRIASFLWEDGRMQPLGTFGQWAIHYGVTDINDHNVAVGSFHDRKARSYSPVMYRDGQVIDLSISPGNVREGLTTAVNNAGVAVGYQDRKAFVYDGISSSFIPVGHRTQFVTAISINDQGLVVGKTYGGNAYNYFWDGSTVARLAPYVPDSDFTPVDINNSGQVLGDVYWRRSDGAYFHQSFIYDDGRYRALAPFNEDGAYLSASDMNDKGWVVGLSVPGIDGAERYPFLWRNGRTVDINDLLLPDASGAGWRIESVGDINERGQIVGLGYLGGSTQARAFIATPVPEPGQWALMLGGLGMVAWRLRRSGSGGPRPAAA